MSTPPALTSFIITSLIYTVSSQIYLPCDVIPVPGCTCLNSHAPIVSCTHLNLTWFPRLSLAASTIHTLNLSHNQLTFFPSGVLSVMVNLRRLDLSHNKIKGLHKHALRGREHMLEWIDLGHNNLNVVPSAFGKVQAYNPWRLTHLGLASNRIHTLNKDVFINMACLQLLDLDGNQVLEVARGAWNGMKELKTLRVGFRRMSRHSTGMYVTSIATDRIQSLEGLRFRGARPQFMGVLQTWLSAFPRLRHLELLSMKLTDHHLTNNSLSRLSAKLQMLSLQGNLLQHIPGQMLASLGSLKKLDLSGNRISKFTEKSTNNQVPNQLSELDLSRNGLRKVRGEAITRLKNATIIDLSHNNVRFIKFRKQTLHFLGPNLHLKLGGNPLRCSCPNLGIRMLIGQQVSRDNGNLHTSEIFSNLRCGPWGKHGNQLMVHVPLSQFECRRRKAKPKHGRKQEQDILKKIQVNHEPSFVSQGSAINKINMNPYEKPITSIFYNRNIHSYLDSEANVDLPSEIIELLHTQHKTDS